MSNEKTIEGIVDDDPEIRTAMAHQLAMDGFKFPIIFMTGLNDEVIRRQAADVGGIAFLLKPFPAKLLMDAIKFAIG